MYVKYLKYTYYIFCVLCAILLSIWCIYQYFLDEDLTQVNFKRFHEEKEDIYPSISLCFMNPYLPEMLGNNHKNNISFNEYLQFLQGNLWKPEILTIDYHKITLDIENYVIGYDILYLEKEYPIHMNTDDIMKSKTGWSFPKQSFSEPSMKCFTVDIPSIPSEPVKLFNIRIKTSIFSNDMRPSKLIFDNADVNAEGFLVLFHYKDQLINGQYKAKKNWPSRAANDSKSFNMVFLLQNIEVIRHRDKRRRPCKHFPYDETENVMKQIINETGCIPPYLPIRDNLSICQTQDEMKRSYNSLIRKGNNIENKANKDDAPCRRMGRIDYDYWEHGPYEEVKTTPYFNITFMFIDQTYREIREVQAFGLLSMFGNIGGYIGIFIGYALLNLPDLVEKIKDFLQG